MSTINSKVKEDWQDPQHTVSGQIEQIVSCAACNGTGFVGPKNEPNTPIELMKVGCCNCSWCNGTGKVKPLGIVLDNALRSSATKISKGRKAN